MGINAIGPRKLRQAERFTRERLVRGLTYSHCHSEDSPQLWAVTTEDHRHLWYEPSTGNHGPEDGGCLGGMCQWLFGPDPKPRTDEWIHTAGDGRWYVRAYWEPE